MITSSAIEVKAVFFENDTTWGESEWINILLLRRKAAHRCQSDALQALSDGQAQGNTSSVMLGQLNAMKRQRISEYKTIAERQIANATFTEASLLLEHQISKLGPNFWGTNNQFLEISMTDNASKRLLLRLHRLELSKPSMQ